MKRMLVNRLKMPCKNILVCEDGLVNLSRIIKHFSETFEDQGLIDISCVSGGNYAKSIIEGNVVDLILLDHDMPDGSGWELLTWMRGIGITVPVITFSGIPQNNQHLMNLGANYSFTKEEVISGLADSIMFKILRD